MNTWGTGNRPPFSRRLFLLVAAIAGAAASLAVACSGDSGSGSTAAPTSAGQATGPTQNPAAGQTPAAKVAPDLKLMKVQPDTGHSGDKVAISGEGLPAGKTAELMWATSDGKFVTEIAPADVKYIDRSFQKKRVSLGKAQIDAQGQLSGTFAVPDDYGETHDIYAVVDGGDVARSGFRIMREVTFSPTSGPVGTPITITVTGMGVISFESTMAALYDHHYMGMVTAVKTRGRATFQIRAAGPVGPHIVELIGAATAVPYLNNWQSPTKDIPWEFRINFMVTEDRGAPPNSVDWPEPGRVVQIAADAPRTGRLTVDPSIKHGSMEPANGPVLSHSTLRVEGLSANTDMSLVWVTAAGSDVNGWGPADIGLAKARTGADGTLKTDIEIPEGLGGWHIVKVLQGEKQVADATFRIDRSFVAVAPAKVKQGEAFEVQIKGLGWTQVDNGVAVTYDNSYFGFACGFGTGGDITLKLVAAGAPGTHLIDLYPMIYQGARGLQGTAKPPWLYQMPFLTALADFPALELGYNLPIFRLAVEVLP